MFFEHQRFEGCQENSSQIDRNIVDNVVQKAKQHDLVAVLVNVLLELGYAVVHTRVYDLTQLL